MTGSYFACQWIGAGPGYPVHLYSELDADRWEVRKVDVFPDGSMGFADELREHRGTFLGTAPVPAIEEIAQDPQFLPRQIDKDEFERVWRLATAGVLPPKS